MTRHIVHKLSTSSIRSYYEALLALQSNLRLTSGQLNELVDLLRIIFCDENFITILEIEQLTMMPACLSRTLTRKMS